MPTRRTFVKQLAAASAATAACGLARSSAPAIAADAKTDSALPIVGVGAHQYECNHNWAQLPDKYTWQTTHNVAVDSAGLVYVIHEGRLNQPDHPSIFVFDSTGKFVRAFGNQFQGGGHGLDIRAEPTKAALERDQLNSTPGIIADVIVSPENEEFLYVTAYQSKRSFAKLTLTGETVWHKFAPMESKRYVAGEDVQPRADSPWGRDRFLPTNFAFHPDGGFFLADGYGGYCIHRYDADGNWQAVFGKPSDAADADGTFDTPHGIWIDNRSSVPGLPAPGVVLGPSVVVADRANGRLQWFSLVGEHRRTLPGFHLPANCDTYGELLLVPDLLGRVTLLDGQNKVIAHLGDDNERIVADKPDGKVKKNWTIRGDEKQWQPGKFVHPHDACFDADGNIYVTEWVGSGRVTKLRKLA